jgi:hypothetical protein
MNPHPSRFEVRMNARAPALLLAAGALLLTPACAPKLIPGSQIEDTDETRAIIALIDSYRNAVEGRDADKLVKLVSSDFRDHGGTSTPEDDLDLNNLEPALRDRFARIDNVRLDVDIRNIEVQRKEDRAHAIFYYTLRFEMPRLADKVQTASELKRMDFRRENGEWRIVSGI